MSATTERKYVQPQPPDEIWIDSAGLPNFYARGYEQYFGKASGDEYGPSDGESLKYVRPERLRIEVLREAAALMCRYCKRSEKYGIAERDPAHDLFAHKKNGARWCEANNIQRVVHNQEPWPVR